MGGRDEFWKNVCWLEPQNPGWGDSIACLQSWFPLCWFLRLVLEAVLFHWLPLGSVQIFNASGFVSLTCMTALAVAPATVQSYICYFSLFPLVTWLKALGASRKKKCCWLEQLVPERLRRVPFKKSSGIRCQSSSSHHHHRHLIIIIILSSSSSHHHLIIIIFSSSSHHHHHHHHLSPLSLLLFFSFLFSATQ